MSRTLKTQKVPRNDRLFWGCKDIQEEYCISVSKAYQHIRRIKELYEIDEERLPRRGVLPATIVKDYFHQAKKKKTSTERTNS